MGAGTALRARASWLGRPWFFVAVAVLALNDHLLKGAWPGWLTGKLSDFAGVVVVATLAAVLLGPAAGAVLAGLAFTALKTVPGAAEAVAPMLGGGITLRDASDLVALLALPPLWWVLSQGRSQPNRNPRGWQALGLVAAVLATTATQAPPPDEVRAVGAVGEAIFVNIFLADGYGERWLQTTDGGFTWTRADEPRSLGTAVETTVEGDLARLSTWTACADDGVCYRASATMPSYSTNSRPSPGARWSDPHYVIERRAPGAEWTIDLDGRDRTALGGIAVQLGDSGHAVAMSDYGATVVLCREPSGRWRQVDVIELARDPQWVRSITSVLGNRSMPWAILAVLSVLCWTLAPSVGSKAATQILAVAGAVATFAFDVLGYEASRARVHGIWFTVVAGLILLLRWADRSSVARRPTEGSQPSFDPPKGAR